MFDFAELRGIHTHIRSKLTELYAALRSPIVEDAPKLFGAPDDIDL